MRQMLIFIFTLILFAQAGQAGDLAFTVTRAELSCQAGTPLPTASSLDFMIDKSLNPGELIECDADEQKCKDSRKKLSEWISTVLRDPSNYHLMEIKSGVPANLVPMALPRAQALDNTVTFAVSGYKLGETYVLVAKDLTYEEKSPTVIPFMIKITANSSCDRIPANLPDAEKAKAVDLKAPTFKEYFAKPAVEGSPRLTVDFSMQGTKKKKAISNFNVKFRPYTTRRLGLGGYYTLTPFFVETEYKANAEGSDKKNVLNVGVFDAKLVRVFRDDGDEPSSTFFRYVPAVVFSLTPKLETEWGFTERKLFLSPTAALPINLYQSRGSTIRVEPFLGFEIGYQWKSIVTKPGKSLQRGLVGAGLTANFLRKADKPLLTFQVDYIRRVLFRPEYSFGADSTGKLVPDRESRIPREHAKFRGQINATEFFSPFVEWEYGRVPPKFNLINSSFRTGIAFNVDVAWEKFN